MRKTRGKPGFVHRIERAESLDHVGAGERVVTRRDHQIKVLRVDVRIQNLHSECGTVAGGAQPARDQGRVAAATDRQLWPWRAQAAAQRGIHAQTQAGREARRGPRPRRAQPDAQHSRPQAHRAGQRQRLALVAGGTVAEQPDVGAG